MKLQHEVALAPAVEERLDRSTLAVHHAVHQGAREIGVGLVFLGLCILFAATIVAHSEE